jgi:CBS domain-containing protein
VGVLSFLKRDPTSAAATAGQVTCYPNVSLEEVINRALDRKVHRVWVVEEGNEDNILIGLISFSDILRVVRHECTVP